MFEQSFSAENFYNILISENRKGNNLEKKFFPKIYNNYLLGISDINKNLKKNHQEFIRDNKKKGTQTSESYKINKKNLQEKKNELKNQKKNELLEELKKISDKVQKQNFKFDLTRKPYEGKYIYTVNESPETFFAMKQLQYNFQKLYKIKQANRFEIVSQLKCLLNDEFPKFIIRTDITSFYESIPNAEIIEQINTDNLLSPMSKKFVKQIIKSYEKDSGLKEGIGIPRGIGISAYLSEYFMRKIDKEINNLPNLTYYSRYVDDIIIIFTPEKQIFKKSSSDESQYKKKLLKDIYELINKNYKDILLEKVKKLIEDNNKDNLLDGFKKLIEDNNVNNKDILLEKVKKLIKDNNVNNKDILLEKVKKLIEDNNVNNKDTLLDGVDKLIRDTNVNNKDILLEKVKKLIKDNRLSLNQSKTKEFDLNSNNKDVLELDYLGYNFELKTNETNNKLNISLTNEKVKKYKDKINKSFELYRFCKNSKKGYRELKNRIKFLTGNTRLKNNKSNVLVGIYFSNIFLTELSILDELDRFLKDKIDNSKMSDLYKNQLLKLKFSEGFKNKIFYNFKQSQFKEIVKAWRNI